ncbi:MAG: putative SOS response-associated peptidase YedK [Chloroflexi bacterium OLB15]|nr:MAG: putative SOS response-associated peptidase YedK [Chloroflexi bacterium OLB15]
MCGRFAITVDASVIQHEFNLAPVNIAFSPRFNIAPTQSVPVITNDHPDQLVMYRWGLIPSWAKDISIGAKMINARAEGIEDKPAFRAAFKRRRCLVPVSGFYEWQAREGGKQPMFIRVKQEPLFAMAGLWEVWRDGEGRDMPTFTIITTSANSFMKSIHDRMPVILHPEDYATWLQADDVPAGILKGLLRPFEPDALTAYDVSKAVNRAGYDSPELIQPVA